MYLMESVTETGAGVDETKFLLLLEDQEFDREVVKRAHKASQSDVQLLIARTGDDAIGFLEEPGVVENLTAAILDLRCPGVDGFEVISRIRANSVTEKLPIIVFSALQSETDFERCLELGADKVVSKPLGYEEHFNTASKLLSEIETPVP